MIQEKRTAWMCQRQHEDGQWRTIYSSKQRRHLIHAETYNLAWAFVRHTISTRSRAYLALTPHRKKKNSVTSHKIQTFLEPQPCAFLLSEAQEELNNEAVISLQWFDFQTHTAQELKAFTRFVERCEALCAITNFAPLPMQEDDFARMSAHEKLQAHLEYAALKPIHPTHTRLFVLCNENSSYW